MFNLKSNDPLDGLVADAEKILAERAELLGTMAKAESNLAHSQAGLAAARGHVAREEFENAQPEGGLAVASKAAQQSLSEAELEVRSARYRLQALQARLKAIEDRLLASWAAVQRYQGDFIRGKIEGVSREFDETLKALVRLICTARAFRKFWPKPAPRGFFPPGMDLMRFWMSNPFTKRFYVQGQFVRADARMRDSVQHPEIAPEALALRDVLEATTKRIMRLGGTLKEAGVSGVKVNPRGGQEAVEGQEADDSV